MITITGHDNKMLKLIRSLQKKKNRQQQGLYFAEGRRICEEALTDARDQVYAVIASEDFAEKNKNFLLHLDESGKTVYTAKENLFAGICSTETPQGIGVVLRMPENMPDLAEESFILALDGIAEPGNLGTIVRTAEAAGVNCIWLFKGCADLYNPKVVRSTMGSLFRMPCRVGVEPELLLKYKEDGFRITATALRDSVPLSEAEPCAKQILVIGSEAAGISDTVLSYADLRVRIPMEGKVESLNAAVAAGIVMYWLKP